MTAPTPTVSITVRWPDWVTCRNSLGPGQGSCGAMIPVDMEYPTRCPRCQRSL